MQDKMFNLLCRDQTKQHIKCLKNYFSNSNHIWRFALFWKPHQKREYTYIVTKATQCRYIGYVWTQIVFDYLQLIVWAVWKDLIWKKNKNLIGLQSDHSLYRSNCGWLFTIIKLTCIVLILNGMNAVTSQIIRLIKYFNLLTILILNS